jgi:hypothetical protein
MLKGLDALIERQPSLAGRRALAVILVDPLASGRMTSAQDADVPKDPNPHFPDDTANLRAFARIRG